MGRIIVVYLAAVWLLYPIGSSAAEFGDIDLSIYALGSWPRDQDISNQGIVVPASIKQGFGAGIRVGLFPDALRRILGLELDSNAHSGALSFQNGTGTGRSDLLITNSIVNLIARYPGEVFRPYVGIGVGWSRATLLSPNIPGRNDKDFESAHALGHQYIAGVQLTVTSKFYVYSEYRYFLTNYHWQGLALDFRTHYGLVGVGLRF